MANKDDLILQQQINAALEDQFGKKQALMDQDTRAAAEAQAKLAIHQEELKLALDTLAAAKEIAKLDEEAIKNGTQKQALDLNGNAIQNTAVEQAKELVAQTKANIKETEKQVKATEGVAKAFADTIARVDVLSGQLLGVNKVTEQLGEELTKDGKIVGNVTRKVGKLVKGIGDSFTGANMLGKAFEGAQQKVVDMNDSLNQTAKKYGITDAIGRAKEFDATMRKTARQVGITSLDAMYAQNDMFEAAIEGTVHTGDSYLKMNAAVFKTSTVFRQASKSMREDMTLISLDLQQTFGVTAGESTQVMQELATTFGKTGPQVTKLTADLAMLAQTQGRDVNKTFQDFANMSGQLAKFGLPSVSQEFARLQAIEEKTGASMNNLVSSMDTFSTFEGALTAASKLNAAFGSTIDGMELMDTMMTGGPAEALLQLRQRLDETGQSFDTMNYAQKRVMAEATGMGVSDLAKFMSTPFDELEAAVADSDKSIEGLTASQEKLKAATEGTLTGAEAQEKLQDKQREAVQFLGSALEQMEVVLARSTNAWVAFGMAAAQSAGMFVGGIAKMLAKVLFFESAQTTAAGTGTTTRIGMAGAETAAWNARNLARLGIAGAIIAGGVLAYKAGEWLADNTDHLGFDTAPNKDAQGNPIPTMITEGQSAFAVGQNFISQPTMATVGEGGSPEIANIKGQNYMVGMGGPQNIALGAGDSVSPTQGAQATGPKEVVMNFTFVDENGKKKTQRIQREFKEMMNEKLQFSYS
jgi:hypothetical protein